MFDDFYCFSGLQPNLNKRFTLFAGVNDELIQSLRVIHPITVGEVPVEYLGVPLISSRLRASDCVKLKDKSLHRILKLEHETNLIQDDVITTLISSVLCSIQVHWGQLFAIPQKVAKEQLNGCLTIKN